MCVRIQIASFFIRSSYHQYVDGTPEVAVSQQQQHKVA